MAPLSQEQIQLFHDKGNLKLCYILSEELELRIQDEIWSELEEDFRIKKKLKLRGGHHHMRLRGQN